MNHDKSLLDTQEQPAASDPHIASALTNLPTSYPAGTYDGVTYYTFHNQSCLTLDLDAAPEQLAFAKTFDTAGPHRTTAAALHDLTLVGHYEQQVTRLDGQTQGTTASDNTLAIADTPDNRFNEHALIVLNHFDGLQSVDGSASTAGLSLDFVTGYTYASQSAFLKSVITGSGNDAVQISTLTAPELNEVAALAHSRVKPLTVDTGAGNDQIGAHIQQADLVINAGTGNDDVRSIRIRAASTPAACSASGCGVTGCSRA